MKQVNKLNPEAYARVLDVVRKADLLVDSTSNGGMEQQFVSQNAWLELSQSLLALRNIIPSEERPAEAPHAVVLFWPEADGSNEPLNEDEVLSAALAEA
jgi:hypothetical protein